MMRAFRWGVPILLIGLCLGYLVYAYFFAFREVSAGQFESIVQNAGTSTASTGIVYGGTGDGYHYFIDTWHSYLPDRRIKVRADKLPLPDWMVRPYDNRWIQIEPRFFIPEAPPPSER
jgi:hypothetical protein